eukprot:TRINITY_DN5306_c0_g1_i2.p2 TRINITY_DN5306_c0_g1~~TRINITY_DN5306_c0_g1_i2.p2  ORF type:complete len:243 (-),score=38.61 TRINITY_DN5306_c0_g1_i2:360-1088(-)
MNSVLITSQFCFTQRGVYFRGHKETKFCRRNEIVAQSNNIDVDPQLGSLKTATSTAPWVITFDLRERETEWTPENQARLVKQFASMELHISNEELQQRIYLLQTLLPDLGSKVSTMKPSTLAKLLSDPNTVAERLIQLKQILPLANLSKIATSFPEILFQEMDQLQTEAECVKQLMGMDDISGLIEQEPRFLDSEGVEEALIELKRLLGEKTDVRRVLRKDPSYLLRVQRGQKRLGENPDEM